MLHGLSPGSMHARRLVVGDSEGCHGNVTTPGGVGGRRAGRLPGMQEPSRSGPPAAHGRLPRLLIAVSGSLALVVALSSTVLAVKWYQARTVGTVEGFEPVAPSGAKSLPTGKCSEQPCNYLLLGSDSRSGLSAAQQQANGTNQDIGGSNRADTIMLVHTDPNLQKAIILSFPRDLWVDIPGHGQDKINAAFEGGVEHGGPQLMAQTVANLSGLRIDHFLYVDLAGFQKVVDTLGGVDLCVPAYDVNTPGTLKQPTASGGEIDVYSGEQGHVVDLFTGLDVKPGCQHMDGITALSFVRSRHLPCDAIPDFARIGRQQQFLRSVINQMLRPQQIVRAAGLVEPVLRNMRRDAKLLPGDLVYLVGQMRGLTTGAAEFRTVPGVSQMVGTKSVVMMDPAANQIFAAIRQGKPISGVGTHLVQTPVTPADVTVVVIDDASEGKAQKVEATLSTAGFDVGPGIWSAAKAPRGVAGTAVILYQPGHEAEASVVAAYLPGVQMVALKALHGVPVAVVVRSGYVPTKPSTGGAQCPVTAP